MALLPATCNRLLARLPTSDRERLRPRLALVQLEAGLVVYERDVLLDYVYFPIGAVTSLMQTQPDGRCVEVGLIGNEGMIGVAGFLGGGSRPNDAVVQLGGGALRLAARDLRSEFQRMGSLRETLLRFAHALIIQISQISICNRLHPTDQRLASWLLMVHDRTVPGELALTHDRVARMLGVRRECITSAARRLQSGGLIAYHRGHLRVLDPAGLEAIACECYQITKAEYARLLDA